MSTVSTMAMQPATLATLPAPASAKWHIAWVRDQPPPGVGPMVYCDGTHWRWVSNGAVAR